MFAIIDEEIKKHTDTKTTYVKAGIFVVAIGVLCLVIYFCFAFTGAHT